MTQRSTPARPTPMIWLAVAIALIASVGCGIPLDGSPRDLAATSTAVPGQTTLPEQGDSDAFLFYLTSNLVVPISEEMSSRRPADVLNALLAKTEPAISRDIVTQIPPGTRLLSVTQLGTDLDVNLSSEFNNLVGTGRTQATAQIVLTATGLSGIEQVRLLIEGQRTQVFSPISGDTDRVGACDYLGLLPTDDEMVNLPIDSRSSRRLTTLRNTLSSRCIVSKGESG